MAADYVRFHISFMSWRRRIVLGIYCRIYCHKGGQLRDKGLELQKHILFGLPETPNLIHGIVFTIPNQLAEFYTKK
jgi:hypothetical protein